MVFAPGKPNPVPPDTRFGEWIDLLADITDAEKRLLARWLTANGIERPKDWGRVVAGRDEVDSSGLV